MNFNPSTKKADCRLRLLGSNAKSSTKQTANLTHRIRVAFVSFAFFVHRVYREENEEDTELSKKTKKT